MEWEDDKANTIEELSHAYSDNFIFILSKIFQQTNESIVTHDWEVLSIKKSHLIWAYSAIFEDIRYQKLKKLTFQQSFHNLPKTLRNFLT